MFVEETIDSYVVASDMKSERSGVNSPTATATHTMICTPDPEMVANNIVCFNIHSTINMHGRRAETANTEEKVGKNRWVLRVCALTSAHI